MGEDPDKIPPASDDEPEETGPVIERDVRINKFNSPERDAVFNALDEARRNRGENVALEPEVVRDVDTFIHFTFPTVVGEKEQTELLAAYAIGATDEMAASYAGIRLSTLDQFLKRNPDFAERRLQLKQQLGLMALSTVADSVAGKIAPDSTKNPNIALKVLAKIDRKGWGKDAAIAGDESVKKGYVDIPARLVGPQFSDFFRDVEAHNHTHYFEPGGRGAGRSSAISLAVIHLIMTRPLLHALVCRQVGNTLRDSVFSQMQWAINELGLTEEFKIHKSRYEITRNATDQTIYFRGLDEPGKLKSLKPKRGYMGIFWLEEADQADGEHVLRNVRQSLTRGGDDFWFFESWNTPRSRDHWINERLLVYENRIDTRIHRSTYLQTPREWLGEQFFKEAEALKESDPISYRHEYLGEAVGYGGEIFPNVSLEHISDYTIDGFDNIYIGVDWGYTADPTAFVKCNYVSNRKALYIYDEYVEFGMSDDELEDAFTRHGGKLDGVPIFADAQEPKTIDAFRRRGFNMFGARKWNGSKVFGVNWLRNLRLIIIDPHRCPVSAKEFNNYSNQPDTKHPGEFKNKPQEHNDHTIDAVRYALDTLICGTLPTTSNFVKVKT
jgi:PBSX family phage terminase large subunit